MSDTDESDEDEAGDGFEIEAKAPPYAIPALILLALIATTVLVLDYVGQVHLKVEGDILFGAFLALVPYAWFFQVRRKIVVKDGEISEYNAGALVKRFPVADIRKVEVNQYARKLHFKNGKIRVDHKWEHAAELGRYFEVLADANADRRRRRT